MARLGRMPNENRPGPEPRDTGIYISLGSGLAAVPQPAGDASGPCYLRAAVPGRGAFLRGGSTAATAAVALALAAGCGSSGPRQDASDDEATYRVLVTESSFPARQNLAEPAEMRITVRNEGRRRIPDLAATVENDGEGTQSVAFGTLSKEPGLASRSRPAWIVDEGPRSGDTAYPNTWALGGLGPGETQTFVWRVTAVEPGRYVLRYRLVGSLTGGARLESTKGGAPPGGQFSVVVSGRPGTTRVTDGGRIVRVPGS
jgi:hypothetical protein